MAVQDLFNKIINAAHKWSEDLNKRSEIAIKNRRIGAYAKASQLEAESLATLRANGYDWDPETNTVVPLKK